MPIWYSLAKRRWNPCFFTFFNDWEVEVVEELIAQWHWKGVCGDVEDLLLWIRKGVPSS